jgi:hypothetical protein
MSDEQTNVDAGSETSGETATVETSQEETTATETTEPTTEPATGAVESTEDAGGAADETAETPNAYESRTAFVTGARQGDECLCPDGRKGTVHKFDEGLVCIPNADQG